MQRVPYASVVGSIMYAIRFTRLDVMFTNNIISRFQQNPGEFHWTAIKNILKYLRNPKDMFLVYGRDIKQELRVTCYTDVGYLTYADDLKSQTGYVFFSIGDAGHMVRVHADDNVADPFTKALPFNKHSEHTKSIGLLLASSLIGAYWIPSTFEYLLLDILGMSKISKMVVLVIFRLKMQTDGNPIDKEKALLSRKPLPCLSYDGLSDLIRILRFATVSSLPPKANEVTWGERLSELSKELRASRKRKLDQVSLLCWLMPNHLQEGKVNFITFSIISSSSGRIETIKIQIFTHYPSSNLLVCISPNYRSDLADEKENSTLLLNRRTYPPRIREIFTDCIGGNLPKLGR
nr:hypothetical protein [Tanacetum cinerariifolium]